MSSPKGKKTKPSPSKKPAFDLRSFLDTAGLSRRIGKFRKFGKVYSRGSAANSVDYIQEGSVRLSVVSEGGQETVIAILGPRDFFGEGCLAGQPVCMGTATANFPTSVLFFFKR